MAWSVRHMPSGSPRIMAALSPAPSAMVRIVFLQFPNSSDTSPKVVLLPPEAVSCVPTRSVGLYGPPFPSEPNRAFVGLEHPRGCTCDDRSLTTLSSRRFRMVSPCSLTPRPSSTGKGLRLNIRRPAIPIIGRRASSEPTDGISMFRSNHCRASTGWPDC